MTAGPPGVAADVAAHAAVGDVTWRVVVAARDELDQATRYRIERDGGGGLVIEPPRPGAARRAGFDQVVSFEVRDLGGELAVLVVRWTRDVVQPLEGETAAADGEPEDGGYLATLEEGDQLYLVRAPDGALAVVFTHVIGYRTYSDAPEDIDLPRAGRERIAYTHAIVEGEPPVVRLARTVHEVATGDRLAGVLDPADPLFAAGAGADVPIRSAPSG